MRKLKSVFLKAVAAIFLLLLVLVLAVLFINRKDQPPSEAALKLQKIAADVPPVVDRDNAYVYVFGLSSPDNSDTGSAALKHVDWLRKYLANVDAYQQPEYPGEKRERAEKRDPKLKQFTDLCRENNRGCAESLEQDPARVKAWTERNAKLIDDYEQLLEFRQWRELWPSDPRFPTAPMSYVFEGQRLMLLKAWVMAGKGEVAGCKSLLERDLKFWRMTLAESSSIMGKLLAATAIEQHFKMGNLVLRQLPATDASKAIPEGWRAPISARERSMERIMANEWEFADKAVGRAAQTVEARSTEEQTIAHVVWAKLVGRFLFQPQATSNANAARMLAIVKVFDREYRDIPAADKTMQASKEFAPKDLLGIGIYNPVGELLVNLGGVDTFSKYGFRPANLEGARRAALLTAQLRGDGVKVEGVADAVKGSELRDPYDGKPFAWNPRENSILFRQTLAGRTDLKLVY